MNKILLATTALVATAGVASAEVSLSGWAEMGLVGGDARATDAGGSASVFAGETQFHTGVDVRFTLSGETDAGLTFGASIDLDESGATQSGRDGANSTKAAVFISGGFGTVTMGDTDGALDWAMQEVGMGSSIADDHTTHVGYNGNSGQDGTPNGNVLRYDNTFGDFGVALSAQMADTPAEDSTFGLGVKYNVALGGLDLGLGLGYQDNGTNAHTGLSVDTTFANGLRAILNYSDLDGTLAADNDSHMAIGLGYTSGALLVHANYGEFETVGGTKTDAYAIAVNYDLGGAAVQFGYTNDISADAGEQASWSLGLAMSF
ncbi:porin [Halocynthiibacter styelae]|uniref:Porin n=1 Tax=Halocynthiibacter styelae TaxID=2761955 RepID=A0A8J7IYU7_9RHOB|nr:porin [Paenihalocynthiibacter styelae]MBI1494749.1 porin [Paenihalocynthiibacter styelae]